jgi:uncharacterized membrane protein
MPQISTREIKDATARVSEQVSRRTHDTLSRIHDAVSPAQEVNVGDNERVASALAGAGLIASGIKKRSPLGMLMAAGGAVLMQRGLTGHCGLYERMGRNTATKGLGQSMQEGMRALDSSIASAASGA